MGGEAEVSGRPHAGGWDWLQERDRLLAQLDDAREALEAERVTNDQALAYLAAVKDRQIAELRARVAELEGRAEEGETPYGAGYRDGYGADDWGETLPRDRYDDPDEQREYERGYERGVSDRLLW